MSFNCNGGRDRNDCCERNERCPCDCRSARERLADTSTCVYKPDRCCWSPPPPPPPREEEPSGAYLANTCNNVVVPDEEEISFTIDRIFGECIDLKRDDKIAIKCPGLYLFNWTITAMIANQSPMGATASVVLIKKDKYWDRNNDLDADLDADSEVVRDGDKNGGRDENGTVIGVSTGFASGCNDVMVITGTSLFEFGRGRNIVQLVNESGCPLVLKSTNEEFPISAQLTVTKIEA